MYHNDSGYYNSRPYHDDENDYGYGHNYRNYYPGNNEPTIKGKIEQKYWKSKQKVIEKLGKDQDEFVIAGDAEVDSRLEAFRHIKMTCMQLMSAVEFYQTRIFALSQDENEMGRFLRDQGATDKTKAGKMMISVGKAQSYAAQQRLSLRAPLVRLFAELETFRFRAVQDTQMTVEKMEQSRSEYRARLLWMADISKELDPDQNKRLGKFRDVQLQVKQAKKLFDKLKVDVVQKIDLLSASRCNLLSATLEAYQTAMVKFLSCTAKSYNIVYTQFQGHPSYQFQILKNIIPNNGIAEDEDDDVEEIQKPVESKRKAKKMVELAEELKEEESKDDDGKLISFDSSPNDETSKEEEKSCDDLLGGLNDASPGFGEFTATEEKQARMEDGFEDLLGKFEENNVPPRENILEPSASMALLDNNVDQPKNVEVANNAQTVDDLLFGSPMKSCKHGQSDIDVLSEVLTNQSLGITENDNSFSSQWQLMFGAEDAKPPTDVVTSVSAQPEVDTNSQMFMPSFLLSQMRQTDPSVMQQGAPRDFASVKDSQKTDHTPPMNRKGRKEGERKGKDMSAWFNLFADLDPLANPDDVGQGGNQQQQKQAC